MKKTTIGAVTFISFLAVLSGALAVYVYTRNFGVDYKGRALLDYNWKYFLQLARKKNVDKTESVFLSHIRNSKMRTY